MWHKLFMQTLIVFFPNKKIIFCSGHGAAGLSRRKSPPIMKYMPTSLNWIIFFYNIGAHFQNKFLNSTLLIQMARSKFNLRHACFSHLNNAIGSTNRKCIAHVNVLTIFRRRLVQRRYIYIFLYPENVLRESSLYEFTVSLDLRGV